MREASPIRAGATISDAFRTLSRAPFRTLLALTVLIAVVADSIGGPSASEEDPDVVFALLLIGVSLYVQIAITLAAGRADPDPSADRWVKAAWRRRCFLRLVVANLVIVAALAGGLALAVVGMFVVGAIIAVAQPAVVLERRGPIEAVVRSAQLTQGSRIPIGIVFAVLFIAPSIALWGASFTTIPRDMGAWWVIVPVLAEFLGFAATIATARMFVALGGTVAEAPTPNRP
ncbi:MAG: hypothetical protein M3238_00415 [Actinomycetota bacterium]|nr:hypothetical protein [Actinomycetota bacterium]